MNQNPLFRDREGQEGNNALAVTESVFALGKRLIPEIILIK